jgi:hypothetical protein
MTPDLPQFIPGERVWHRAGNDYSGIILAVTYYADHVEYLVSWGIQAVARSLR